ncbi:DUF3761 domain-containing protein [Amycolatopsis sp. FDAARGOS 1241]|nr:DUF3761 domain-containing protein [Amycolatopsis sp. FDAARGOS 1241]QRP50611.1 DUF3761 domain-containing protein [Amycolatopsis sp. FDAARGOS 1241]
MALAACALVAGCGVGTAPTGNSGVVAPTTSFSTPIPTPATETASTTPTTSPAATTTDAPSPTTPKTTTAQPKTTTATPHPTSTACGADYYRNSSGVCVHRPSTNSSGATAICKDGSYSYSQHRSGTCSGHGGVKTWL